MNEAKGQACFSVPIARLLKEAEAWKGEKTANPLNLKAHHIGRIRTLQTE